MAQKINEKRMGETTDITRAWLHLGRFIDKGYAVAVSRPSKGRFHVRAVRSEKVVEAESASMAEAISEAYGKVGKGD